MHRVPSIQAFLSYTGLHQPDMFHTRPEPKRMKFILSLFNDGPNFGRGLSLHPESTHIVCGLITLFIHCLPQSVIPTPLFRSLWHCAVKPTDEVEAARRHREQLEAEEERKKLRSAGLSARNLKPHIYHRKYHPEFADDPEENDQIKIAQTMLRCLPQANLSLLLYMCDFFSRILKVPENGMTVERIGETFGKYFCGCAGGLGIIHSEKMLVWLVTRWHRIIPSLLPDAELARRKSREAIFEVKAEIGIDD